MSISEQTIDPSKPARGVGAAGLPGMREVNAESLASFA
jgi:hypothetical protein